MKRIINHWTGGGGRAAAEDLRAYHMVTEWDGTIVMGKESVEDNIVTSDGDYAAHTLHLNTLSIGLAMCGMRDAKENPFSAGPSPISEKQFYAHCVLNAEMCRKYGIPVTRETVLTHAEVEPTLGVKQRGKWDLTRLPFRPDLRGAYPVGDYMRETIRGILGDKPVTPFDNMPQLKIGNTSPREEVKILQRNLINTGNLVGKVDGLMGRRTRAALVAFQVDNGLVPDGIAGPNAWAAFDKAPPAPEREVTEQDLKERGSKTITLAQKGDKALTTVEGVLGTGVTVGTAFEMAKSAQQAEGAIEAANRIVVQYWPVLAFAVVAVLLARYGKKLFRGIITERVQKARNGTDLRL